MLIKCCFLQTGRDIVGRELAQAGITRTGIVTGGKTLGGISRPGKPRPGKRPPGNRLIPFSVYHSYHGSIVKTAIIYFHFCLKHNKVVNIKTLPSKLMHKICIDFYLNSIQNF